MITNYDDYVDKTDDIQYRHELFNKPFRMLIAGSSGSGKTNFLVNLLVKKFIYYENVIFFSKTLQDDRKYEIIRTYFEMVKDKVDEMNAKLSKSGDTNRHEFNYMMVDDVNQLPKLDDRSKIKPHTLIVLDDAVNEIRENKQFHDFCSRAFSYVRHRKSSIIIITQKLEKAIPTFIRSNTTHFIIFGHQTLPSITDLTNYLPLEYDEIKQMFEKNIKNPHDFFVITKDAPDDKKVCLNFSQYINIRDFSH